ncbi:MAG: hypothetical protein ACI4V1_01485 [Eubacteriales bacterium]
MRNIKQTLAGLVSGALLLTSLLSLASCDDGPELLGIVPVYNGPEVTSTTHEFKNEDFMVIATYADGTDVTLEPDDFEVVVEGMESGYYILNILYEGEENECFVPMELSIYPSDNDNNG